MKLQSFFIACLLALVSFFACFQSTVSAKSNTAVCQKSDQDGYTYVPVVIDGVTWIFVYDQKGNLVNSYPEE